MNRLFLILFLGVTFFTCTRGADSNKKTNHLTFHSLNYWERKLGFSFPIKLVRMISTMDSNMNTSTMEEE
ncbi:MAG: hypothetical protein AB8B72_10355 [Crocinitomicaceae bacterium]